MDIEDFRIKYDSVFAKIIDSVYDVQEGGFYKVITSMDQVIADRFSHKAWDIKIDQDDTVELVRDALVMDFLT